MPGAIPLLPQYAFMAWCSDKKSTGTSLPLLLPPQTLSWYVRTASFRQKLIQLSLLQAYVFMQTVIAVRDFY